MVRVNIFIRNTKKFYNFIIKYIAYILKFQ